MRLHFRFPLLPAIGLSLCLYSSLPAQAQTSGSTRLWRPELPAAALEAEGERHILPDAFQVFELNMSTLRSQLAEAPLEFSPEFKERAVVVEIPLPDGVLVRFHVWESPVMEPGLASRYPGIRTYAGRASHDASMSIRFDLTPQGFHAMMFTRKFGTVFIDPLFQGQDKLYQVYAKKDYGADIKRNFSCSLHDTHGDDTSPEHNGIELFGDCSRHIYRMALSCTGEYAQFHGGTKPLVLGAMVTTMNRVNFVFEQDFAVRMNLVANTDTLIFLDPLTDPFTNDNGGLLIDENISITDSLIGESDFDIGHVFGTSGGGAAFYAVVCDPFFKAGGFTGLTSPVGDPFDIDYVSHEIGHQFSGSHPFRGCGNNSVPSPTAVEPGSGSTIMAYAGICGDNVQNNSDAYFHGYNLEEMSGFVVLGDGQTCGTHISFNNASPVISGSAQSHVIPANTPFFLTAQASDPDGDSLTYCWEQFDTELSPQPPLPGSTGGPNFRTFLPTESPTRYFPALSSLANGGPFTWEVLPAVSRDLHFRVSVRDNAVGGSCTGQQDATVTVTDIAGPFVVTNPDTTGIIWASGGQEVVYWNTGNTQFAPVSCSEVDILLSTDGGLTYPIVLASNVPNNGLYPVQVPGISTNSARVMVVCSENIFFDISNQNFSIQAPALGFALQTNPTGFVSCGSDSQTVALSVSSAGGFAGLVTLSVAGLPQGVTGTFAQNPVTAGSQTQLILNGLTAIPAGQSTIVITGNGNGGSQTATFLLNITPPLPATPVVTVIPVNGATQVQPAPWLVWSAIPDASTYTVQVASDPGFASLLLQQSGISANQYQVPVSFPLQTTLYWRVKAENDCGEGNFGPSSSFSTTGSVCTTLVATGLPVVLDPVDPDTVYATVALPVSAGITDVNVPVLTGTHDYMRDVRFTLISPAGTASILSGPVCEGERDFNIRFDDQATAPYNTIPCPPTDSGLYQPKSPLATFNGEDGLGVWTLEMADVEAPDGGSLTNWSLELCYATPANTGCNLTAVPVLSNAGCVPCGTEVTFALSNATGATGYLWNDGATDAPRASLCQGSYSVTIVDAASCSTTVNVVVPAVSPAPLVLSASASPSQGGDGTASVTTTGGQAPYTYLWSNGDTTATIQQLAPGSYTVTVTDVNGCSETATVVVEGILSVEEQMGLQDFLVMPNPGSGEFRAQLEFAREEEFMVAVYAANGQCLERASHRGQRLNLVFDLAGQSEGLYFLSVRTARGSMTRSVLLVK